MNECVVKQVEKSCRVEKKRLTIAHFQVFKTFLNENKKIK